MRKKVYDLDKMVIISLWSLELGRGDSKRALFRLRGGAWCGVCDDVLDSKRPERSEGWLFSVSWISHESAGASVASTCIGYSDFYLFRTSLFFLQ